VLATCSTTKRKPELVVVIKDLDFDASSCEKNCMQNNLIAMTKLYEQNGTSHHDHLACDESKQKTVPYNERKQKTKT
jgi:hypothetical protein